MMQQTMIMQEAMQPPPLPAAHSWGYTKHRPRVRFHVRYEDFIAICGEDEANGDALRVFEWQHDQLANNLKKRHAIPESHLPAEEDLWFSMSLRALEELSLSAQSKSTYARCLVASLHEDEVQEDEGEAQQKSLLEWGYIERRFVAFLSPSVKVLPDTVVYRQEKRNFIVVHNESGDYIDLQGRLRNVVEEGVAMRWEITRQYRYCLEAVNKAIAALDWDDPPPAMPRWRPVTVVVVGGKEKTSRETETTTTKSARPAPAATQNTASTTPVQEELKPGSSQNIFCFENIIDNGKTSMVSPLNSHGFPEFPRSEQYRHAPWGAETILGLLSGTLHIPDPAEDAWPESYEAAQRLDQKTRILGLSPTRAWEAIDLTSRYMETPGSPSWWQRDANDPRVGDPSQWRKTKAPVTVINLADNFERQWADFQDHAHIWYPRSVTPYDGPPDYGGYEGYAMATATLAPLQDIVDDPPRTIQEPPSIVEVVAATDIQEPEYFDDPPADPLPPARTRSSRGILASFAYALAERIRTECPSLSIQTQPSGWPMRQIISLQYAPDYWINLYDPNDWDDPPAELQPYIQAMKTRGITPQT